MKRGLSGVVVLALGAVALAGCSGGSEPAAATSTSAGLTPGITARGLGTVTKIPDTVTIVIGVQTRAQSAKAGLEANTDKATALINVLKSKESPQRTCRPASCRSTRRPTRRLGGSLATR